MNFPATLANLTEILSYQQHFGYGLVYVTYEHYETPDWLWFSGGVVLASIELVTASILVSLNHTSEGTNKARAKIYVKEKRSAFFCCPVRITYYY